MLHPGCIITGQSNASERREPKLSLDFNANDINPQNEEEEEKEEGKEKEGTLTEESQSTSQLESSGHFPVIFQLEG